MSKNWQTNTVISAVYENGTCLAEGFPEIGGGYEYAGTATRHEIIREIGRST